MSDLLVHTTGIVLRTTHYGDTSIIVSIFTQKLGIKSYIVNGVRSISKKGTSKSSFFQPAALLDLVVYNNEFKNLNRIKEYKWSSIYKNIYANTIKNCVCIYMIELFLKVVKETEQNDDLYGFLDDCLQSLDDADAITTANFPLFFTVHLSSILGFSPNIQTVITETQPIYFDVLNAAITPQLPNHIQYITGDTVLLFIEILRCRLPEDLNHITANAAKRNELIDALQMFYRYHITDFIPLKSLPILRTILG